MQLEQELVDSVLVEAIRVLDLLCEIDPSLVPQLLHPIKKVYNRIKPDSSPLVLFSVMVLFVSKFFEQSIVKHWTNHLLAYDVLDFFATHQQKILESTDIFRKYVPVFLRLLAWSPFTFDVLFRQLLPSLVSMTSYIELFHLLLIYR
eukprot:c9115_g1_i4.p1 GENE.c9115_g1_i4~~c9115_g1_i4.p1  ORF type:complete len:147 (+),score=32.47 c9115_g1_i4:576-1016(+)